mgnify:CR=1 FL=1
MSKKDTQSILDEFKNAPKEENVKSTCTEQGYTTYTCACGDSYVADEVAAKGHTLTQVEAKAPTCTEAGYTTYTCIIRFLT